MDALDNYDKTRGYQENDSIRRFFQEQIVGHFGPTVHMMNIMRRLAHVVGTGAWDPRVWPYYQKLHSDLWEDWMRVADQLLDDEQLLTTVYEALAQRRPQSRTRGRLGTPTEVVLRPLLLKHIRNWNYEVVEREVRANLVHRAFTRVGGGKFPDDTGEPSSLVERIVRHKYISI